LRRCLETCGIVKVGKVRREQHVPRERVTRGCTNQASRVPSSNDLPAVIRYFWNARLLRAPPLSSIA